MNDRELLELAARAHGGIQWDGEDPATMGISRNGSQYWWRPLEDDGDALRLAVQLNMRIYIYGDGGDELNRNAHGAVAERHGSDKFGSTRRAIVRAAAEIGKSMTGDK